MRDAASTIISYDSTTLLAAKIQIPLLRMRNVKAVETEAIEIFFGDANCVIDDLLKVLGTRRALMGLRVILKGP